MSFSIKTQASYLFIGKIASFIIRLGIPIILVRVFTQEEFGIYRQLFLVGSFFVPILQMSMSSSIFFFFSQMKENINQLYAQTFYFLVLAGLLVFPILYIFRDALILLFKNDKFYNYSFLCASYSFFTMIAIMFENILILEKRNRRMFAYVIGCDILRVILIISAIYIYGTFESVFIAQILLQTIIASSLFIYLIKKYSIFKIQNWDKSIFWKQIRYSFPLGLGGISTTIGKRANGFIINAYLSASSYAVFTIGAFKIPLVGEFYASIARTTRPQFASYWKEGKNKKSIKLWHKQISIFFCVTFPLVLFFFIMAHDIITLLYTDKYAESVNIFRILIMLILFQSSSWGTIPKAYNATNYVFKANTVSMIIGVIIGLVLISNFGLYGAAISAVLTFFIEVILLLVKSKSLLNLKVSKWLPWKNLFRILIINTIISIPLFFFLHLEFHKLLKLMIAGSLFFLPLVFLYQKLNILDILELMRNIFKRGKLKPDTINL